MSRCYNHIIYTMCYVEEKLSSIQLDITKIWKSTLKLLKISATSEKKRKKKAYFSTWDFELKNEAKKL